MKNANSTHKFGELIAFITRMGETIVDLQISIFKEKIKKWYRWSDSNRQDREVTGF